MGEINLDALKNLLKNSCSELDLKIERIGDRKLAIFKIGQNANNSIHIAIWKTRELTDLGNKKAIVISLDGGIENNPNVQQNMEKIKNIFQDWILIEIGDTGYFYKIFLDLEEFLSELLKEIVFLIKEFRIRGLF